ncbi:MAG: glycosyltransferase [Bowdeniella nasicola]|nr:glycosyltransferase [Bowdeniella nasicola]
MKVALTKGTVRIPPTYFFVDHALHRPDIDWSIVCLAADVRDPSLAIPIRQAVPGTFPFRLKEVAKYAALRRFRQLVIAEQPALIHQHMLTWSIPALRAARTLDVPMVVTIHGTDAYIAGQQSCNPITRMNRRHARSALGGADLLIAVSRYIADQAIAHGAPETTVEVLYQGVDTAYFTPKLTGSDRDWARKYGIEQEVPTFLFVGALNTQKGVQDLIQSSRTAYRTIPHRVLIIGDGPLREDVIGCAAHSPHITYLGARSRTEVRSAMRTATFTVLPTRTVAGRQEAAGLVLLESQACGTPVIVNDVGGTKEMTPPNRAWLTDESCPTSLTTALIEAATLARRSPHDYERMSHEVRHFVETERSAAKSADELTRLYQRLLQ